MVGHRQGDRTALGHGITGIEAEIHKHLLQLGGVGQHPMGPIRWDVYHHLHSTGQGWPQQFSHRQQGLAQPQGQALHGGALGKEHELLN